jgi:hypothetical protein
MVLSVLCATMVLFQMTGVLVYATTAITFSKVIASHLLRIRHTMVEILSVSPAHSIYQVLAVSVPQMKCTIQQELAVYANLAPNESTGTALNQDLTKSSMAQTCRVLQDTF